jgi:predicted nucleic acid-binding protein
MIFADTSILVDYLKARNPDINIIFENEDIAICGVVLAELIHGIKSDKEKTKILNSINELQWINIDEILWKEIGINLNLLKKNGLSVPFQDVIIATVCIKHDLFLFSHDKHFERIAGILEGLKLYKIKE